MNASDVMSRDIISVGRDTTIAAAIRLMLDNQISGLPVIDPAGKLVGILTEGDLLRRAETGTERHRPRWLEILMGPGRLASEYVRTHGRRVDEIMTRQPVSVTPDTPLDQIVALMERRRIKRVPVLDGELPVGIVSRADLLRALARTFEEQPVAAAGDEEIRERILAEFAKVSWVPRDGLSITVADGIVGLDGVILDEKEREALRVAAENVPGSEPSRTVSSGSSRSPARSSTRRNLLGARPSLGSKWLRLGFREVRHHPIGEKTHRGLRRHERHQVEVDLQRGVLEIAKRLAGTGDRNDDLIRRADPSSIARDLVRRRGLA